jgi:bacteriocin biosynthesis cyclodehydratase domain-containing protein
MVMPSLPPTPPTIPPGGGADERAEAQARPRLRLHLEARAVPDEGLYVAGEREPSCFAGELWPELLPLLDGRRAIERVLAALPGRVPEAFAALDRVRARGLLADGPPEASGPDRPMAAFWEALGADPGHARRRLQDAEVSITALGGQATAPWRRALRALEIEPRGHALPSLTLVLTDDHLHPELAAIDARAREDGRAWLLVRPEGVRPWLGPLFVPGRTGCWVCLAQRLRGHRRLEAHVERKTGRRFGAPPAGLPSTRAAVIGLVTTEVAKWLALGRSALEGAVITLDLETLDRQAHPLTRRPQCPACGRPARPDAPPVRPALDTVAPARAASLDGGYRIASAEDAIARLERHVSPITGIIGSVTARLDERGPTPVVVTDHGFAEMDAERWFLREGFRKRSGGKGTTRAQAMASALGESIERWCGVFQGDEPRVRASRAALGPAAIHPNACMGYSDRQYRERERWNALGSKVRWVPEPFDDAMELEWTPLWCIDEDAPRWLPAAYCWYGHPAEAGPRVAAADSNGCAAGSTLDEAVLQGLFELVERDCVALWWYNRVRRPGVALESFEVPWLLELVEHYRGLGRELWALDVTSDLGIPAFAAVSRRVDVPREDVILGFAAHVDARTALVRAMTEMGQSLPSVPGRADGPEARLRGDNHEAIRWWSTATLASEPYLQPDPAQPRCTLADHPSPPTADVAVTLRQHVERLAARGLHTLVLDQTRPDVGLPVARVVVPGLRHFWARFGPGRLYDVPVALGWRPAPLPEAQLNDFVVYF